MQYKLLMRLILNAAVLPIPPDNVQNRIPVQVTILNLP